MTFGHLIDKKRVSHCLDIALTTVVVAQIALYVNELSGGLVINPDSVAAKILIPLLLALLLCIVIAKRFARARRSSYTETSRIHLDAMVSLSGIIRHRLNNDMQVVLGNAELAQILVKHEGNLLKPLQNITEATDAAIERIEALAVVGRTGTSEPDPIDLNAVLRESMARLVSEIPSTARLRLELEPLSSRVFADRFLLSLSLAHLVTQASGILRKGVDVAIRSTEIVDNDTNKQSQVQVELWMLFTSIQSVDVKDVEALEDCLVTTKALVERSSAQNVKLSFSNNGCCMSFRLTTEVNDLGSRGQSVDESIRPLSMYTM
ncbi:hypothetical protein N9383_02305 [Granulosicoccus sp.]|nr:hypothetical protein [Granulosicoccus sp.]